jgi:hypothetical protein
MCTGLDVITVILVKTVIKLEMSRQILESKNLKYHENQFGGSRVPSRRTDVTKLTVAFPIVANATTNYNVYAENIWCLRTQFSRRCDQTPRIWAPPVTICSPTAGRFVTARDFLRQRFPRNMREMRLQHTSWKSDQLQSLYQSTMHTVIKLTFKG